MDKTEFRIFHLGGFSIISFSDPFEILCRRRGRLKFLKEIAAKPQKTATELRRELKRILFFIKSILKKGINFEAAWIWSDLAYKDNLFFSPVFYKKYLFPIHKKLISFLDSRNMTVIFHSDGKIDNLVPSLLKAGVKLFYPVDTYANMDIKRLNMIYGNVLEV